MKPITGSIVALVTPMHENGELDFDTLRKLIEWHIEQGTDCLGIVGTTGESATVTVKEHCELIRFAVECAAGRVPVMAGCGANSTPEAINLAKYAREVGATCQLQVVPYYNKPTQQGMYQHFKAIAEEAGDLPIILYNVPGRTGVDMQADTVLKLSQVKGIAGIKEASGNMVRACEILKSRPENFSVYSGDDQTALLLMLLGGQGNVSVTANILPKMMHDMCIAAINGDLAQAKNLHYRMMNLNQLLFVESNPIPVKWALAQMGKIRPGIRLPLTLLDSSKQAGLRDALQQAGLIPAH